MATRRKYTSGADFALMTDEDLDRLGEFGDAWNAAHAAGDQAGMDAAHAGAEALRAKYNYSGGADGSEYNPFGDNRWHSNTQANNNSRVEGMEEFSYESAPTYTSKYQDQIDELLGDILNRPAFEYDPETDPRYAAYRKEYAREGDRATADTMAQYASMTGGMPSTAATAAAQQAGNYYAAQMADKIPELYALAYSMYQDEGDNLRLNMDMLTALEQGDYNKYLNLLSQYNTDRNFAYGVYSDDWNRNYQLDRDDISDSRYDMEWNYGVNRDQISDQRYEDETAWNREQYTDETEYARALERAQTLAQAGDFSGYKALGYSDSEIASLQNAYNRAQAAASLSRSGGSSGRSSGSSSWSSSGSQDYGGLYQAALESGYPKSFISNNYKRFGFTSSSGLYDGYESWAEENTYNEEDVSAVAKGLLTDLRKYYASQQDQEAKARQEYESGGISWTDYLYLADKLGFGG